jgi:hypothetical protein
MIRSIRGSKWSIDFSEIRLPDEGDALTVVKDRKKGESFACSTGHAFTANRALAQWIVIGLTSRVERVGFWPSPPPRQTVRTDFPYTAFAVTSSDGIINEDAKPSRTVQT